MEAPVDDKALLARVAELYDEPDAKYIVTS